MTSTGFVLFQGCSQIFSKQFFWNKAAWTFFFTQYLVQLWRDIGSMGQFNALHEVHCRARATLNDQPAEY
jgi:hypothetical protein